MIEVKFQFASVDEAIVALGKLVGAPGTSRPVVAGKSGSSGEPQPAGKAALGVSTTRRGRSDKGQARGPHKAPAVQSNVAISTPEQRQGAAPGTAGNGLNLAVTDPSNAAVAATLTSTPATASVVPDPLPVAPDASLTSAPAPTPSAPVAPAAAVPKLEDLKASVEKLFAEKGLPTTLGLLSRYGVKVHRDLKPEQYVGFIADVERVLVGGEV